MKSYTLSVTAYESMRADNNNISATQLSSQSTFPFSISLNLSSNAMRWILVMPIL